MAAVPAVWLFSGCSLDTAKPATYVTDISATLNGEVSSNQSGEVLYWFEYGTTTDYGEVTPDRPLTFPEGHNADGPRVQVSEPINGLEPDTTYHFRACSSPGAEEGSRGCTNVDQTFTTGPAGASRSGIAFGSNRAGNFEVYVMDADGGNPTNLTNNSASDSAPAWSPDGSRIAFESDRDFNADVWVMDADGGNPTNLTNAADGGASPAWSPDGSRIAFECAGDNTSEVCVMDADGGNPTYLTNNLAAEGAPAWSPRP
jgi:WD40 repeat protein